jgi:hypothetical protein
MEEVDSKKETMFLQARFWDYTIAEQFPSAKKHTVKSYTVM